MTPPPTPPAPPSDSPPTAPPGATPPGTPAPRRAFRARGCLLLLALLLLFASLAVNVAFVLNATGTLGGSLAESADELEERFYLGDKHARDKVAVVRVSGVISEGSIAYPIRQLKAAAADKHVKAVVLRVDSPGGTVSASDELYKCIVNLRDNDGRRFPGTGPKPVSVSMGALAASGGYYVAVAGSPIVAEPTTITGSIGVFAAIPNVAEFTEKHGIRLELIKDGRLKASGSFFHKLSPEERQTWQDTVDSAYEAFLGAIAKGRPGLTPEALRSQVVVDRMVPRRDEKGNPIVENGKAAEVKYTRVRADGGTFTPQQARDFGLIDGIDDLPGAIRAAAARAGLMKYKAVVYDRPTTLLEALTGLQVHRRATVLEVPDLSAHLIPNLVDQFRPPMGEEADHAPIPPC